MRSIFVRNLSNLNEKGIKWKDFSLSNNLTGIVSACWSDKLNMLCVVVYGEKNEVVTTTDFEKWNTRYLPKTAYWENIVWSPELNMFCIVGNKSSVATSIDGINWVQRNIPDSDKDLRRLGLSPDLNKIVISAGSYDMYYSLDGITWNGYKTKYPSYARKIIYSTTLKKFYILNGNNYILSSTDGINWDKISFTGEYGFDDFCYSSKLNLFCAVKGSKILTSIDCSSWNSIVIGSNHNLRSIIWISEYEIFICSSHSSKSIFTSNDGINWEETIFNDTTSLYHLIYADKLKSVIMLPYKYYPNSPAKIGKLTK